MFFVRAESATLTRLFCAASKLPPLGQPPSVSCVVKSVKNRACAVLKTRRLSMSSEKWEEDFSKSKQGGTQPQAAKSVPLPSNVARNSTTTTPTTIIQVETKERQSTTRAAAFVAKPVVIGVCLYAIASTVVMGFSLNGALKVPGLNDQIDALEQQVDELEYQVDRLHNETNRLEAQNDRLEALNDELEGLTDDLNETVTYYAELNAIFNESNAYYQELNDDFNQSLTVAQALNTELNGTVERLQREVDELEALKNNLTDELDRSEALNTQLMGTVEDLNETKAALNTKINDLNTQVDGLEEQNQVLNNLTRDLLTILSFLNETSGEVNESVEAISAYLADQINENRILLLGKLKYTYIQKTSNFKCNYDSRFGNLEWGVDKSLPIGATNYSDVIDYVNETVLTEICANSTDFEYFLVTESELGYDGAVPPVNITSDQLIVGVDIYTTSLLDYYFPDAEESGLNMTDWVLAEFECEGLREKQFLYGVSKW